MRNAFRNPRLALAILAFTAFSVMTSTVAAREGRAATSSTRPIPGHVDLDKISFQIVAAKFVTEYEGATNRYQARQPDQYRAVVVTLRVTKPAGLPLTLQVPDITLHYYFGESSDVLPCSGISGFSTEPKTDRPMVLLENGYGRSSTGPATTEAKTVYVDVFFQNLEPNTNDLYVFLGRPAGQAFRTKGWSQ